MNDSARAYRARYIFPATSSPIAGGVVTVVGGRIVAVGREGDGPPPIDLGDVAIIPGLVNAHVHLEFSDLKTPLGQPGMRFPDWIRCVVEHRSTTEPDRGAAISAGLEESLCFGTTTLGEIATGVWDATPYDASSIQCTAFYELIAIAEEQIDGRCQLAAEHLARDGRLQPASSAEDVSGSQSIPAWHAGLSPHAPYTVHPELVRRLVQMASQAGAPVAMHLAESPEELELLSSGTGLFFEALTARGFWNPQAIPPGTRPMDYLRDLSSAPRSLVIHGNYLDEPEIAYVAEHADRMSVVYCPRTHEFFGHPAHPLPSLLEQGANVALGTDGRSSNPDLSLLAEMRTVARRFSEVAPAEVLRLGTIRGARALGCDAHCGSLDVGKQADLTMIPIKSAQVEDPHDLLFASEANNVATIIEGEVVYRSGIFNEILL